MTLHRPGQFFFLQDDGGGIRVNSENPETLNPGDEVEVAGFPATGNYTPA